MRICVLAENTAISEEFTAEYGLSLYIETTDGQKILFDMGQSDLFITNAEKMGIDLRTVDFAVLSHGHFDHGGGLEAFLSYNATAPVYLGSGAYGAYYNADGAYIGLDHATEHSTRLIYVDDERRITPNITLYSASGRENTEPLNSYGLCREVEGVRMADDFTHERYMLVEENGKRILFSGCSHRGILNIAEWFAPDVIVGGFHFLKLDPEGEGRQALRSAAEMLMRRKAAYYTCHCTGCAQYAYLKTHMGEQLSYLATGAQIVL